jgi:membrane protein involved in colicin uptake
MTRASEECSECCFHAIRGDPCGTVGRQITAHVVIDSDSGNQERSRCRQQQRDDKHSLAVVQQGLNNPSHFFLDSNI